MVKYGIKRRDIERGLTEERWDSIIACAQEFSTAACQSIYNYISKDFGEKKKAELVQG